jgi:hypothetical protein
MCHLAVEVSTWNNLVPPNTKVPQSKQSLLMLALSVHAEVFGGTSTQASKLRNNESPALSRSEVSNAAPLEG